MNTIIPNLPKSHNETAKKVLKQTPPKTDEAIKGVLLNNYIKKQKTPFDNFENISNDLLIPQDKKEETFDFAIDKKEGFDYKKALKPLVIATGVTLGGIGIVSAAIKNFSSAMAKKPDLIRPGDLARNINILEEPHFAMYRALREPSTKNIIGLGAVGIMSAFTLCAKNFIDGASEIWVKKQNCDIEHDLQQNLIEVETKAFSGKLNVINDLLVDTTKYFKEDYKKPTPNKPFLGFKGKEKTQKDNQNENKKTFFAISLATVGLLGLGFGVFKNYQKTAKNLDTFVKKYEDKEIQAKIAKFTSLDDKKSAIKSLSDLFKSINAKDDTIKSNFEKIKDITTEEIEKATHEIKQAQIYANAPEALGGITEKIQYYCYINEERGHLYNWVLNPENKFNKYLFLSFSALSSIGYIAKTCANAIKTVTVERENSKSELNLKKELVRVEIDNFKAKKLSAINPLIENYKASKNNKSEEELKTMAENILREIKNGPPYVYS